MPAVFVWQALLQQQAESFLVLGIGNLLQTFEVRRGASDDSLPA